MILELWRNRFRPSIFTPPWARSWAKRLLTLPSLIAIAARIGMLRARGARIADRVVMSPSEVGLPLRHLSIGEGASIGRVVLQLHAEVQIGRCAVLNDGVCILTGTHDIESPSWGLVSRGVQIGDYAWIATNAMILPGVKVGRMAVVGAGSVVRESVPDGAIVFGNPASVVGTRKLQDPAYVPSTSYACVRAWLYP